MSGERGEDEGHGNIIAHNGYVLGFTNRNCDNFFSVLTASSNSSIYGFAFYLKMLI